MSWETEWPYHITVRNNDYREIEEWCNSVLGQFNEAWYKMGIDPLGYMSTGLLATDWYFKKEKDAVLFALRWS
jgi:hypothetical protein